jgi:hypothetical protein
LAAARPAAALGIRWVLVARGPAGDPPAGVLAGLRLAYDGPHLRLWENPSPAAAVPAPAGKRMPALAAHLLAAVVVIVAAGALLRGRLRSWYGPRTYESGEGPWPSWPRSLSQLSSEPSSASSESSRRSAR